MIIMYLLCFLLYCFWLNYCFSIITFFPVLHLIYFLILFYYCIYLSFVNDYDLTPYDHHHNDVISYYYKNYPSNYFLYYSILYYSFISQVLNYSIQIQIQISFISILMLVFIILSSHSFMMDFVYKCNIDLNLIYKLPYIYTLITCASYFLVWIYIYIY